MVNLLAPISVCQQMTVFWLADVIAVAVYLAQASMYVVVLLLSVPNLSTLPNISIM